ncbi:PEP-CTERM sorting domain-containing protein [Aquabacterium fontiphilum]|jgi:phospholipase/lecithinase/hemolysin|uniref:SGNH/GDSL hydrolase family protein n=1 Tax=Aquabacterium fontiphilum TaxID=450365 RepID=UPI0013790662|nr:SGNH/GDSL hydrolase family protein [Aquabacterium fontiphilum]NBD20288.1 PEP-CTERM sorting domain-containing protein [Aquabacterium fontiphilum]
MAIRHALAAALVAGFASLSATSAQAYSQIIVFGDSLSDTGNASARLGGLAPASPYVDGRFSNGPVAVEVMAQQLGLPLVSYAFGGAQTGNFNQFQAFPVPQVAAAMAGTGMADQVATYTGLLALQGQQADAQALHVVWGGGNDFLAALSADDLAALPQAAATAVGNLASHVQSLYGAGARSFLVPLMPDFATSYFGTSNPALAPALSQLTLSFNQALSGVMQGLQGQLAGADIIVFDTPSVLAAVRGEIVAEGGNVVARCWAGNYLGQGASVCANPDQYFLFDSVHPTARVHAAVGTAMAAAVPEPSTWLMLVVGLVCVGLVIWRRQPHA